MSVDTLVHEDHAHAGAAEHHDRSDGTYVLVAFALAVMTAVEVGLSYITRYRPWPMLALLLIMTVKFVTVALYFMHLKDDPRMCRRVFFAGLGLAVTVYVIFLTILHFWAPHYR